MKIEKVVRPTFAELKSGDVFYYYDEECVCIKTDEPNKCVALDNGATMTICPNDAVGFYPDAKLIFSSDNY
jgi:hypothetical protein